MPGEPLSLAEAHAAGQHANGCPREGCPAESQTYLARNPCGCVSGLVVDEAAHRRSTARELARWVRQGCSIERIETASVRRGEHSLKPCAGNPNCVAAPHRRRQSARQQSLL